MRSILQWAGHAERMADDILLSIPQRERQSYMRRAGGDESNAEMGGLC